MNVSLKSTRSVLTCFILISLLGTASVSVALDVGEKAPDFKLPATTGADISLSDFKGKKFVLIEFYGAAFVPT